MIPQVTAIYGAEHTTNEYIQMLDKKRKEAEAKNIRYEVKLEKMKKLQIDCLELTRQVATTKKSLYNSQIDFERRFEQETIKKIEDEFNRRSKLEQ